MQLSELKTRRIPHCPQGLRSAVIYGISLHPTGTARDALDITDGSFVHAARRTPHLKKSIKQRNRHQP